MEDDRIYADQITALQEVDPEPYFFFPKGIIKPLGEPMTDPDELWNALMDTIYIVTVEELRGWGPFTHLIQAVETADGDYGLWMAAVTPEKEA